MIIDHNAYFLAGNGTRDRVDITSADAEDATRVTPVGGRLATRVNRAKGRAAHYRDDQDAWYRAVHAGTRRAATDHAIRRRSLRADTERYRHITPDGCVLLVIAQFLPIANRTRFQWFVEDVRTWQTVQQGRPSEPDWTAVNDGHAPVGAISLR